MNNPIRHPTGSFIAAVLWVLPFWAAAQTTGPALVSSSPANGATGVALDAAISFTFSEVMQTNMDYSVAVIWFDAASKLVASSFSYSWSADQKTLSASYSGGLPPSDTITWTLNAGEFLDLAGNPLNFQPLPLGTFTTTTGTGGGGSSTNCSSTAYSKTLTVFSLFKSGDYVQTDANAPTPEVSDSAFGFFGAVTLATNRTATGVTLAAPAGVAQPMMSFLVGQYFDIATTNTEAALDTLDPAGTYTFVVSGGSAQTVTATMPANALPNAPHVSNFSAAQTINASAAFTLAWDPMAGGQTTDAISLAILDGSGNVVFQPQKNGCPAALDGTATSILIPANTFASNQTYTAQIDFIKNWTLDTNSYPSNVVVVSGESQTKASLSTGGGSVLPAQPVLSGLTVSGTGVAFRFTTQPGHGYVVEANSDLANSQGWAPVRSTNAVGTTMSVQLNAGGNAQFYRVRAN